MKTYNVLSKLFTDKVKNLIKEGKPIDEAFEEVKSYILDVELTQGDGEENGHHYVDLGLSVKWATCNVGASIASDEGLLFQFGRVDGYRYGDENHQFRTNGQDKEVTGSDYIPLTASGATYNAGATLSLADDAAHTNMEGNWRMPIESEFAELLDNNNTEKTVVTVNGVNGMLFTSKKNGHRLFIPFMQWCWDGIGFQQWYRSFAFMWSSQVYSSNDNNACNLGCNSNNNATVSSNNRTYALSVRGVF